MEHKKRHQEQVRLRGFYVFLTIQWQASFYATVVLLVFMSHIQILTIPGPFKRTHKVLLAPGCKKSRLFACHFGKCQNPEILRNLALFRDSQCPLLSAPSWHEKHFPSKHCEDLYVRPGRGRGEKGGD